uniref:Ig-like domain-containing protein n=1 Tax=Mastacembelus armatus TaxID=205130 RepID=A0A3Q3LKV3_9TELE
IVKNLKGSEYFPVCLLLMSFLLFVTGQKDYGKCLVSQEEFEKNEGIKAKVGSDVILPCLPKFDINSNDYTLEWSKDGGEIFVIRNEHPHITDSSYNNRLTVPIEEFKKGNASLKISGVKEEDGGDYCCCIRLNNEEIKCADVTLGEYYKHLTVSAEQTALLTVPLSKHHNNVLHVGEISHRTDSDRN